MGKSLIDKLQGKARKIGRNIRNYALLGTAIASIGLASCQFPGPNPNPTPTPPNPNNYVTISGVLKNNDTGNPVLHGLIRAYNSNQIPKNIVNGIDGDSGYKNEITVSNGGFSFQIDKTDLTGIILQAEETDSSGNPIGYVGTIDNLPVIDISDFYPGITSIPSTEHDSIRVVPYVDIDGDGTNGGDNYIYDRFNSYKGLNIQSGLSATGNEKKDYKQHVKEVATDSSNLVKFNVPYMEIATASHNNQNYFSGPVDNISTDLYLINEKAQEWINAIPSNFRPTVIITNGTSQHYIAADDPYGSELKWSVIMPDDTYIVDNKTYGFHTGLNNGVTTKYGSGVSYTIGSSETFLLRTSGIDLGQGGVASHEIGLEEIFKNEAQTLSSAYTIMTPSVDISSPSGVDIGATKIVYGPTYQAGEDIDNIMRLNWGFSSNN